MELKHAPSADSVKYNEFLFGSVTLDYVLFPENCNISTKCVLFVNLVERLFVYFVLTMFTNTGAVLEEIGHFNYSFK